MKKTLIVLFILNFIFLVFSLKPRTVRADTRTCTKTMTDNFDWLGYSGTGNVLIENQYIVEEDRNIGRVTITAPLGGVGYPVNKMTTDIIAIDNLTNRREVFSANFLLGRSTGEYEVSDPSVVWSGPTLLSWNITGIGQIGGFSVSHTWYYDDGVWYDRAPTGINITNFDLDCPGYKVSACPTGILSANPLSISTGGSSTLTWNVSNLGTYHVRIPGTTVTDSTQSSGSVLVSPATTTTYTLEVFDPATGVVPGCYAPKRVTVFVNATTETWKWRINRQDPTGGFTAGYNYEEFNSYTLAPFEVEAGEDASRKEPYRQQAFDEVTRLLSRDRNPSVPNSLSDQYNTKFNLWSSQQSADWLTALASYNNEVQAYNLRRGQFEAAHQSWQEADATWQSLYGGSTPGSTVISPVIDPATGQPVRPMSVVDTRNRQLPR
jgi:hypothetical protein